MTRPAGTLSARFDPLDPGVIEDPYPTYARLRALGPVCRAGLGSWLVLGHADVAALLADPRLGNQRPENRPPDNGQPDNGQPHNGQPHNGQPHNGQPDNGRTDNGRSDNGRSGGEPESTPLFGGGPAGELSQRIIAGREGADHVALRRILATSIRAGREHGWRPKVAETVDRLLAPALDGAPFDVVADLAFPLQALVVCDLLGIPAQDRDLLWPTAVELGRAFIPYRLPTPEIVAEADRAVALLRDYLAGWLGGWLDDRRAAPGPAGKAATNPVGDSTGELAGDLAAAIGGPDGLTREDVLDNLVFLLFAGFEPTMNMGANGIDALLAHPGQQRVLAAEPELGATAVEEFLRYDAPTQYTMRIVREPLDIGGRSLRPGRLVLLGLGSANRDPERFADPDSLDVRRHPNPHLSFGGGSHHCTGWAIARAEGAAVFTRLFGRVRAIEPAGPARRLAHPNFRAHEALPVRLLPA